MLLLLIYNIIEAVFRLYSRVVSIERIDASKSSKNHSHRHGFLVHFDDTRNNDHLTVHGRFVINCAGLYSDKIAAMVGANNFKIMPRKGRTFLLLQNDCYNMTVK